MATRDNALPGESSRPARWPKRSREYGIGKEIGGAVYVHRRYESVFGSACQEARKCLPSDFRYTVVKLNVATRAFSFIQVDDFDSAPEPTIGTVIAVKPGGSCRRIEPPTDPYIYHHKWLFVADDYDGFDVEESKARSGAWLALPEVDKTCSMTYTFPGHNDRESILCPADLGDCASTIPVRHWNSARRALARFGESLSDWPVSGSALVRWGNSSVPEPVAGAIPLTCFANGAQGRRRHGHRETLGRPEAGMAGREIQGT